MKIALVCCLHGNEKYGLEVAKRFPNIPFFIGNKKAREENRRFIDSDMNRSFPGKGKGNYEEREAKKLLERVKDFDYVIDLHSTSEPCPLFCIVTKPSKEKIDFARKLGVNKIVIMNENFAKGNSLIDFTKCGVSLEIGPEGNSEVIGEVCSKIRNLLEGGQKTNPEIFIVEGIIEQKYEKILIENFKEVKKGEVICENEEIQIAEFDFFPILVGEKAYKKEDILCLVGKQVNLKDLEFYE